MKPRNHKSVGMLVGLLRSTGRSMKAHTGSSLLLVWSFCQTATVQAQQYWDTDGVGAVINTANWSPVPSGPFTSAFTANGNIVFGANSSVTGATVDIGDVTVNNGVIVNFTAGGTLGTGGNVRTLDVGTNGILNLSSQALSTAAGTGFIKNGNGILFSSNGNAYLGGFTLNAGTVIVGGVNAMGAGGVLNINGGTIAANAARDLTGKYTNIVIGGNFGIGAATTGVTAGNALNRFQITFSNTMDLGAATRTITANGVGIFGGAVSGAAGVGFTKEGIGAIVLTNTGNTYSGPTQVNAGTLSFRTGTADSTASTYTFGAGTALGLGVGTGRFTDAEVAAAFLGTVPASLSTVTINAATNISLDTTAAAHTFSTSIGVTTRGLEKIIGGNNLTLSGANQYSGRTVVGGGGALIVSALGNIGDLSSNVGTNSTIDLMKDGRIDISTASSSNKNFNISGTAAEPSVIFPGSLAVILSGSISTETAGAKQINFGTNAALTIAHEVSGIISDGSGTMNVRKINTGRIILSGANTFTGTTTVAAGLLELTNSLALQNSTLDTTGSVTGTASVGLRTTTTTMTLGGLSGSKNFAAASGVFITTTGGYDAVTALTLNPGTGAAPSYAGGIANGVSGMTLTKSGAGLQTLTGLNTHTGSTFITGGTLSIDSAGSINASNVTVNGGTFRYNSSVNYSQTLTFTSGTIAGSNWNGSLSGLTIGANKTISPGNSPGTATTVSQTWASSGSYLWEINNATGTAGADPGWDLENGSGTLDITAASGSEFNLLVTSLTLLNAAGLAANFNDALSYNWLIADFNAITGFAANAFNINTIEFDNPFTGTFGVSLGGVGLVPGDNTQIYLTYTAVPEPGAALLGGLGLLALLRRRRA